MNFNELESLIDKINISDISLFELTIDNIHLKMDKSLTRSNGISPIVTEEVSKFEAEEAKENLAPINKVVNQSNEVISEISLNKNTKIITAPMVGTFYESPGAGLDAFVKIGQKVEKGDTLCIIEAMKLMNEIEADITGEIIEILVQNGQMVEFGTELFKVRS
ncbi:MAG: acetyl-CoA carboxylase biotin carboxyl carrier protein [Sarcina sp.]